MLEVTPDVKIDESEIEINFIRASGPGGQNVNKVSSAAQLRWDVRATPALNAEVKARLVKLAGGRVTEDGILIIEAKRYRTQEQNRLDAIARLGHLLKDMAAQSEKGLACAKLVAFANAPEDNPFMAGAFHGAGEPDCALNVGISGPGVVRAVVAKHPDCDLAELSEIIRRTVFKITRAGELVGRELARRLGVTFGVVDISLAPTTAVGDSVGRILEAMGMERVGAPGTTAALALLIDAVKRGGAMASGHVGGLSGTFIPVSEDLAMIEAVERGALSLEKLEAMTAVCSVGLDMFAIPGDTPAETIAAIIADELAIGMANAKTTGCG